MEIRPAHPDDAEALAAVRRDVFAFAVMSPATVAHMITTSTPDEQPLHLVGLDEGRVVAWGSAAINTWTSDPGQAGINVHVHPEHRLRGIGGALSDRLHEHLQEIGAVRARAFASSSGVEFAKRRGYDGTRQMHYSGIDLRQPLPDQPPTPDGIELVGLDQVTARQAYLVDSIAGLDEPGDSPSDAVEFDQWVQEIWESPGLDKALSVAALAGDEIVAYHAVETAGDRAWAGMTGTLPAYRGKGLAKLVKSVALRRAAAAGIVGAFTSNDDENGPMLAVNNWLGYRRVETQTGLLRLL
ncbi:GNAT family N-acetyltransferase [Kribbella sp. NPDC051770]|uniref:GNAT family N-acetyltransferase n=1 Tax=Kribbella sp. NPDC051770 TaxID=3155413 RepID=UPI00343F6C2F